MIPFDLLFTLLQYDWKSLFNMVSTSVGLAGIALAAIAYYRYKKIDRARASKIEAEAEELREKKLDWRVQRDEKMFGISNSILDRLNSENHMRTQQLDQTEDELREIKKLLFDATNRCSMLEAQLKEEKEKNAQCQLVIDKMRIQLDEQRAELDSYKNHKN